MTRPTHEDGGEDNPHGTAPSDGAAPTAKSLEGEEEEEERVADVEAILGRHRRVVAPALRAKYEREAAKNWDKFYKVHQDRFFRDKNWTIQQFDQLATAAGKDLGRSTEGARGAPTGPGVEQEAPASTVSDARGLEEDSDEALVQSRLQGRRQVLLEVGCGTGALVWPLMATNPGVRIHACDFSQRAIDLMKAHPSFDAARVHAFTFDLVQASETANTGAYGDALSQVVASHPFGRPTTVSLIFVLSAIPPRHHVDVLRMLASCLDEDEQGGDDGHDRPAESDVGPGRTGGAVGSGVEVSSGSGAGAVRSILFRDFARGDVAQLRYHTRNDAAWAEPALLSDGDEGAQHPDGIVDRDVDGDDHGGRQTESNGRELDSDGQGSSGDFYRKRDNTLCYFFTVEYLERVARLADLEGEVREVRRTVHNRRTGVVLPRRFVQATWRRRCRRRPATVAAT